MELMLVAACKSGDDSLVLSLINSGVNVNCLARIDCREWSPLMMASDKGHTDVVQLLLERGAQVDLQNNVGLTALIWASDKGHTDIVKLLLERGAQIDLQNNDEWTALMMASSCGQTEIVKLLLERGAQVDLQDNVGQTVLIEASDTGQTEIVKLLLERGAQIDLQDNFGLTALMWASDREQTEIVKLLLERGAQVDLQNNYGYTALVILIAGGIGNVETAQLLLEHGARVDLETNDGDTAMNMASSHEILDLLLSAMIPQLINLLQPVAHKWRELGEHLGLKETTLNQCYSSAKEEEGRLQAVMNTWSQQNDPRPTWRALIRAVEMVDRDLAQNMDQLVGKY